MNLETLQADVVVAGGGNAALVSALTASEEGASVLMLEGSPREWRGGNSQHTRNMRCMHEAPQDVLTSDGVSVRVTAAVRWRVVDVRAFVEVVADPVGTVYLAVQVALRDALVAVEVDTLVRDARRLAGDALTGAARAAGAAVGVEVVEVVVKDVILPHELRAAYAELVTARTHGQAQLEAARAETAALRSLANGAKLLDDHPALARLRLVQALPHGSTLKVQLPGAE